MKRWLLVFILGWQGLFGADYSDLKALQGPPWVDDAVVYAIFPRQFSAKGNLNGVTEKLPEIQKLGASIIWLLPIHPIGEKNRKGTLGSPYSVQDYYAINPAYGTKDDFRKLVYRAHQLGLKVLMDAVVDHTSWDSNLIEKKNFYKTDEQGNIMPPMPNWNDVAALDYNNTAVRFYIIEMLKYWIKEFDIDGYRFDAASLVPIDFWKDVRRELLGVKKDILLVGEEDLPEDLAVAFDLDYAWDFEQAVNDVLMNGSPATESLKTVLEKEKKTFPQGSKHLRFIDNHDKKRAITRYGEKGALAASVLIFTLDGVPMVYNGMEAADTSESTDPALFEKVPIFWGNVQIRPEFAAYYPPMISLRRQHPALRDGDLVWLKNSDESRIATYLRKNKDEEFLIAINFSNQPFEGTVENTNGSKFQNLTPSLTSTPIQEEKGLPALALKPFEFRVYMRLP